MEVQRRWRREGDWRVGSVPCSCRGVGDGYAFGGWGRLGAVGCEREEALRAVINGITGVGGVEVVEEGRDLEEDDVESVGSSVSSGSDGEEKTVETSEIASQLKDASGRIRVPRVLKRGERIPDNWWEGSESE